METNSHFFNLLKNIKRLKRLPLILFFNCFKRNRFQSKFVASTLLLGLLLLLFILMIFSNGLFSKVIFIEGNSTVINSRLHLIQQTVLNDYSNKEFLFYTYHSYNNGFNQQILSEFTPYILPPPDRLVWDVDQYGNVMYRMEYETNPSMVTIISDFLMSSAVDLGVFNTNSAFPISRDWQSRYSDYLGSTANCPMNNAQISSIANNLTLSQTHQTLAVVSIFNWVLHSIDYDPGVTYISADRTINNRAGNRAGIINLLLSMLRSVQIPCRCVDGISLGAQLDLTMEIPQSNLQTEANIQIIYPKSLYHWIEIFFPDLGWVSFDPFLSFFFTSPGLLRRNEDTQADRLSEYLYHNNQQIAQLESAYYVDVERQRNNLSQYYTLENGKHLILLPRFNSNLQNRIINIFSQHYNVTYSEMDEPYRLLESGFPDETLLFSSYPSSLAVTGSSEALQIAVAPNAYYYQQFNTEAPLSISRIDIPLLHFNNDPMTKIWVVIYTDNRNKPANLMVGSQYVEVNRLPTEAEFKWISFTFSPEESNKILPPGKYWISLRYDSKDIILWCAEFGNPFGGLWDTVYIDGENFSFDQLGYYDFGFKLYGRKQ